MTQGSPFTILTDTDPAMSALPETPGLLNDPKEKALRWKKEQQAFYPAGDSSYLLIAVEPKELEVVNEKYNITGDSTTWKPPALKFESADSKPKRE